MYSFAFTHPGKPFVSIGLSRRHHRHWYNSMAREHEDRIPRGSRLSQKSAPMIIMNSIFWEVTLASPTGSLARAIDVLPRHLVAHVGYLLALLAGPPVYHRNLVNFDVVDPTLPAHKVNVRPSISSSSAMPIQPLLDPH
jgi:hypothetical protein